MSEAIKHDSDKVRYELVPTIPLQEMAKVMTYGAKKYAPENWRKGMDYSRVYGALQRHVNAWWRGIDKDEETGLSHLAHAMCCISFLIEFQARGTGVDDRAEKVYNIDKRS